MTYQRPPNSLVLEGILTTLSAQGLVNIAPMGPIVDEACTRFVLRPFRESTTYRNLNATRAGVFHVVDDVLLLARAAVGHVETGGEGTAVVPAQAVEGVVLAGACRYYELRVVELDDREERTTIVAEAVGGGRLRDYFGLNRARHAVLEAAILATRLHLTGPQPVLQEFQKLGVIVEKTGGLRERQAMQELREFVESHR